MRPVLLINGFLAPSVSMRPLQWRLSRRGVRGVRVAGMPPLCVQGLPVLADAIERSVARALHDTGADQVDLVGVSQGGLAALWWLQQGGAARTRRFVALGSPFRGTWFALAGLPALGAVSQGVWDSLPNSQRVATLGHLGVPAGVACTSVAIPGDPIAPPERCRLSGAAFRLAPPTRVPLRHQALILSSGCADVAAELLLEPDT